MRVGILLQKPIETFFVARENWKMDQQTKAMYGAKRGIATL